MDPLEVTDIPEGQLTASVRLDERRQRLEAAEAEPLTVSGPGGRPVQADGRLWLGVEKFRRPRKHYRVICLRPLLGEAWLCQEDDYPYRRRAEAALAGQRLAETLGVRFSDVRR